MQNLGTLGGTNSVARAINNSGQVVGGSEITGDIAWHAFLYSGGVMQDLGGTTTEARGINDSGQVVGISTYGFMVYHAFLYSGGVVQDIGTLGGSNSYAYGINGSGQVVGTSEIAMYDFTTHAFIYSGGVMTDLNTLLPSGSGWILTRARAINDQGQIVGSGSINGEYHAYLMSPVTTLSQQIDNTVSFVDSSVSAGTLTGSGSGTSAEGRLGALENMLETAGQLIIAGDIASACQQLLDAYKRTDGLPNPSDFVTGDAASELAAMIQALRTSLGCN